MKIESYSKLLIAAACVFAPLCHAQDGGVAVRISSSPSGVWFNVDGQYFPGSFVGVWPKGSKHILSAEPLVYGVTEKTRYAFKSWTSSGGELPSTGRIVVTADPSTPAFLANFETTYALTVSWFGCSDAVYCPTSGTIIEGGAQHQTDFVSFYAAGSSVQLSAVPSPGFVFGGWAPGPYQSISGMFNTVTMNQPMSASPIFQVARSINFATVPAGLDLFADRSRVATPSALDWGWGSTHTLGAVTPQQDINGVWWAFSSWSDGGEATHIYKVGSFQAADTVTATYVPVAVTQVSSLPPGLALKVDNRDNWPSYNFPWGIGETHRLEAPAQLTDGQGRLWSFAGWSNGGNRVQDFTVPSTAGGTGLRMIATYNAVGRATVRSSYPVAAIKVDGADCALPCDIQRPVGTKVQVTAASSLSLSEGARADFSGWPGSGSTAENWSYTLTGEPVNLNLDYHVMNRLVTAATPPEGASWRIQPNSPDGFYDAQTTVLVNISALPGFRFRGWNGDAAGTNPTATVDMNLPRSVQASLDRVPYIAPAGIENGAGATPQDGVAPGSLVSIFGASLAPSTLTGPESPMAQTLADVTVRVGGRLLPLFFVSPGQINVLLPDDIPAGRQVLTVSSTGMADVQAPFTVVRNAPGLFQQSTSAVALHEDGSPVTADSPARRRELLSLYGTGFGPADHPRPAGFPVPAAPPFLMVDGGRIQAGDTAITPENAFSAPGKSGIDIVQFRLPDALPAGNIQLRLVINGQDSNTVALPVQ